MMNRKVEDKKRELYEKSKILRRIAHEGYSVEKQKEIRKEQDDAYKRLQFISNLENAIRRSNG